MKEDHQQAIEEKDVTISLLNDDLQKCEYENVALQARKDVYQAELQKYQDIITHLGTHYAPANDKFHDLPYYIARIQRRKRYIKLRWFDIHFPDHEIIVEIGNPNGIHAFNQFEEEGHAERRYNHFRLIDLTLEDLCTMGYLPSLMMMRIKTFFSEYFVSDDQI